VKEFKIVTEWFVEEMKAVGSPGFGLFCAEDTGG
jgi:hypothetical protein